MFVSPIISSSSIPRGEVCLRRRCCRQTETDRDRQSDRQAAGGPTDKDAVSPLALIMASKCPKCDKTVYFAEKVSSLGKDWHKFCLKCERCSKTLNPGGHAEHDGKPFCHKPCYAALFGPKGVNIGGAGSYVYDAPVNEAPAAVSMETNAKPQEEKKAPARGPVKAASFSSFSGGPNICPRCNKTVYFAEKVSSLGKNWHRPCLRCERCSKTLAAGSHAEHDGQPYCHKPCYAVLFGPKGVNTGGVGSYIYDEPEAEAEAQP
ncbi:cysteine-rich protein 2-like [Brachyistius frenatus]|uniref:cysteine-rich protein 2-like n=2 Tax=Embiotocidae TaxID=50791 RepID=UPI0037E85E22